MENNNLDIFIEIKPRKIGKMEVIQINTCINADGKKMIIETEILDKNNSKVSDINYTRNDEGKVIGKDTIQYFSDGTIKSKTIWEKTNKSFNQHTIRYYMNGFKAFEKTIKNGTGISTSYRPDEKLISFSEYKGNTLMWGIRMNKDGTFKILKDHSVDKSDAQVLELLIDRMNLEVCRTVKEAQYEYLEVKDLEELINKANTALDKQSRNSKDLQSRLPVIVTNRSMIGRDTDLIQLGLYRN